jgi:energy-converting hydrogenase Eha subunit C
LFHLLRNACHNGLCLVCFCTGGRHGSWCFQTKVQKYSMLEGGFVCLSVSKIYMVVASRSKEGGCLCTIPTAIIVARRSKVDASSRISWWSPCHDIMIVTHRNAIFVSLSLSLF